MNNQKVFIPTFEQLNSMYRFDTLDYMLHFTAGALAGWLSFTFLMGFITL